MAELVKDTSDFDDGLEMEELTGYSLKVELKGLIIDWT